MKHIQALGWLWYNHTPEMFAYCMLDVNRDWPGYVAGKHRLFADAPLTFIGSLSEDNLERFIVRLLNLYRTYQYDNSLAAAQMFAEDINTTYGIKP